jgi:MFS family permease
MIQKNISGKSWLNRNVFAFGLTSFLSDFGHEMATAVLPQFMQAIGASAATLGLIEGSADAVSSLVKLGAGYRSDQIGQRKPWTVLGYFLTAIAKALFAFAFSWPLIMLGRVLGWLGRGIRGPLRDAMLAESVAPELRGKAFGFHRASDTAGAVVGPLAAYGLLSLLAENPGLLRKIGEIMPFLAAPPGETFRLIFFLTLIPGILAVVSFAYLVTESKREANQTLSMRLAFKGMPKEYRSFLIAVGLFGMADFAPTLMMLRAATLLEPQMGAAAASRLTVLLYLWRNVVYAAASYPIGALSTKFSRGKYLACGYGIGVITFLAFALPLSSKIWFALLFALAGVFIAWEDTIEGVAVRDYVGNELAGTAYGILGTVNGVGDFISSFLVGVFWSSLGPSWGFGYAAVVGAIGMVRMFRLPPALTKIG